jgi:hypothetical protein
MTTWDDVTAEAPELAALVQRRFEATGLGLLATLRADGSPRISGLEPLFSGGELWLGMMPGSRKSADLQRDPRFALHGATIDKNVTEADVKVAGRAVPAGDDDAAAFATALEKATGHPPPPGPFDLYRVDVTEVVSIKPGPGPSGEVDHLDIDSWHAGRGRRHVERR